MKFSFFTYLLNVWWSFIQFKTEWVEDLPQKPKKNTVYVIGGREYPFYVAVSCPRKACKEVIHLKVGSKFNGEWEVKEHKKGTLSLSPSVHVVAHPCRCHYWFKNGRVVWCELPSLFVPTENR